jgi:hypothetical protein
VKLSTLWATGEYTFQGVRDAGCDMFALLGISPDAAHLWLVPAEVAEAELDHATRGPGWITVNAARPPQWLEPYGGDPSEACADTLLTGRSVVAPGRRRRQNLPGRPH